MKTRASFLVTLYSKRAIVLLQGFHINGLVPGAFQTEWFANRTIQGAPGLKPGQEIPIHILRNPDSGFTPGSILGFGPDSGSTSVAVSSNKNTEPPGFTLLAS